MTDWTTLSFLLTAGGFLLAVLALAGAGGKDLSGADGAVEALEICGFLAFLTAFILTSMVRYGDLDDTREVEIAHVVCSYLAVLLIIIGLGVYGGKVSSRPPPYVTTLLVAGALMATLGGTFGVLKIEGY